MEIQPAGKTGSGQGSHMRTLFYPNHILFRVENARGTYRLRPASLSQTEEALVLPAELAGIIPGTAKAR
jgi:hypothetical protein